jgi:ketosteroid isomerase-like protein
MVNTFFIKSLIVNILNINHVNPISATAYNNVFVILRVSLMQIQSARREVSRLAESPRSFPLHRYGNRVPIVLIRPYLVAFTPCFVYLLAVILCLYSSNQNRYIMENVVNASTDREQIKAIIDKKIIGIYNRDEYAVLSVYSPGVVSFDFAPPLQNKGIDAIKKRLQGWFASYMGHITQKINDLHITIDGNIAFSHSLTRTYGTGIKGEELDMWYRTTTCYKKTKGQWLIVHEHISDPVDFETGKILFDLKPIN